MQSDRAMLLAIGICLPLPEFLRDSRVQTVYLTNFCLCSSTVNADLVCVLLGYF